MKLYQPKKHYFSDLNRNCAAAWMVSYKQQISAAYICISEIAPALYWRSPRMRVSRPDILVVTE